MTTSLLELHDISVSFPERSGHVFGPRGVSALDRVQLQIRHGESVGIVGESGSGKTTLSRIMLGLQSPTSGHVTWCGMTMQPRDRRSMRPIRVGMQAVFQDPVGSLDPRMTAGASIGEALEALGPRGDRASVGVRVADAMQEVGLDAALATRYPHQLSGGQCQRVAIARAMIRRPSLLICDEAVSALDVSVQAQIVNLLRDLHVSTGMALVFISHNIAVVRMLCDRIVVLQRGRIVEDESTDRLFQAPGDPYTKALIAAVPGPARTPAAPGAGRLD